MDSLARQRLQTLLSVDDIVKEVHGVLESKGALNSTYFLFTSDHGFHMGQFCLGPCKRQPYETDIRVPFMMRGPHIKENQVIHELAGIPDVGPTVLELCGLLDRSSLKFDGRSLVPLLEHSEDNVFARKLSTRVSTSAWRSSYLIEYIATESEPKISHGHVLDNGNNTFRGIRVISPTADLDLAYFEFTDPYLDWNFEKPNFFELYNLTADPDQLYNVYSKAEPSLRHWLASEVQKEFTCSGSSCA